MIGEIKYCKFCNKEKPIEEFVKSGFAIKNICRECQNKKQTQIYKDSKKVKELEKENQELKQKINTYENPNDLTLMFMYCNEKARDMIEELKKELKEKDDFINKLQATKNRLDKYDYERTNQQKEFIEWLERKLFLLRDEASELALGMCSTDYQDTKIEVYKEVLSKCKEMIGVKDEKVNC